MSNGTAPSKSGSGFFGILKDALFEDNAATQPLAAQPAATQAAGQLQSSTGEATLVSTDSPRNPMVDRMMEMVMEKTTAYTALIEAATPLEAFIPDEASRYKAAFGIVGKTRSLEQIVQSIDMQHLPALEAELQRFRGQVKGQQDLQINARLREIESLRASMGSADGERKRLESRLQQLNQEVDGAQQKVAGFEKEIAANQAEISQVNAQFERALDQVKSHLVDARAKVIRYLGP